MKNLKKMLFDGAMLTVIIMMIYYLIANIVVGATEGASAVTVTFGRFMLIFLFGMLIALANLLYRVLDISLALKIILHYALTLVGFALVFLVGQSTEGHNVGAWIFSRIIIFTVFYFLFVGAVYLAKYLLSEPGKGGRRKSSKPAAKAGGQSKKSTSKSKDDDSGSYTPRYK
ncbi:MAG: DUF3021 family protein [Clostridia bacterium]|nr:DUF3021 family protein [Clostridia bacterium]